MLGKINLLAAGLLWGWVMLSAAPGLGDSGFIAGVTDLPLMPGLREIPEATLIFDKPDGRLVRATATVERADGGADGGAAAKLWRFYGATLPQLGWRQRGRGSNQGGGWGEYFRDGEVLRIEVEKNDSILTVRFAIAPGSE
jgi:hypothetical protein